MIIHFSLVKKTNQTLPEIDIISKKSSPLNKNKNNHRISHNNHYQSFEKPPNLQKNSKFFDNEDDSSCSCFCFLFRTNKNSQQKTKASAIDELTDS